MEIPVSNYLHHTQIFLTANSGGHFLSKHAFGGVKRTQISPWVLQSIRSNPLSTLLGAGTRLCWPTSSVDSKLDFTTSVLAFPAPLTAVKHRLCSVFQTEGEKPLEIVQN